MATIIQTLPSLSIFVNLPDLIAQADDNITLQVQLDGKTILEEELIPDADSNVTVRVRDIVASLLSVSIPDENVFEQTEAVKTFTFNLDDESVECTIVLGGVDGDIDPETFLKANWLTWQPQSKKVKYSDPEWLSCYAVEATTVKLKAYYYDGTNETIDLVSLTAGSMWSLNVQFSYLSGKFEGQPVYFDIWTENSSATKLSFIQRYILIADTFEFDDVFVFGNSLGGIDTVRFTGVRSEVPEFEISSAELYKSSELVDYDTEPSDWFKKNTGFLTERRERQWANEFINASLRYYLDDGDLKQITISDVNVDVELDDFSTFYYEFTFRISKRTKYLNFARTDELPENVEVIDPDSEVFFLAPRLVDFPSASLGNSLLIPVQSPYLQEWKQITFGAIKSNILEAVVSLGFVTGDGVSNYVDLSGYATLEDIELIAEAMHTHSNLPELERLDIDEDGILTIDGRVISAGDADSLGGIPADQYFHTGNANLETVDWTMKNGTVAGVIGSPSFTSDQSGWQIGLNSDGESYAELDKLNIRGSLFAKEFVLNQTRAMNGNMIVSNSARLEKIEKIAHFANSSMTISDSLLARPYTIVMNLKVAAVSDIATLLQLAQVTVEMEADGLRIGQNQMILTDDIPVNSWFLLALSYYEDETEACAILNEADVTTPTTELVNGGSPSILGTDNAGNSSKFDINLFDIVDETASGYLLEFEGSLLTDEDGNLLTDYEKYFHYE